MTLHFSQLGSVFSDIDAGTAASLVASTSDVALIVNESGIVQDSACAAGLLSGLDIENWRGKRMDAVVDAESRSAVKDLLSSVGSDPAASGREIYHPSAAGDRVLVRYSAHSSGTGNTVLLLGRDLTPTTGLQARLLSAQQSLEANHRRHRQVEARYRMLFEIASEPFLIVDGTTQKIQEANLKSAELLHTGVADLIGRKLSTLVSKSDRVIVSNTLSRATVTGDPVRQIVELAGDGQKCELTVVMRGAQGEKVYLISIAPDFGRNLDASEEADLIDLFHLASEGVVLTDEAGVIVWANESFLDLSQYGDVSQVTGRSLAEFLDQPEFSLSLVLDNAQRHERLRFVSASMRGATGQVEQVELSVVAMPSDSMTGFGVVFRNASLRVADEFPTQPFSQSAEQFISRVGKVPLKTLVRDSRDVIERNCIEAALHLTGDNRARTASVLGLSRQSLYNKMRRFGLLNGDDEAATGSKTK